MEKDQPQFNPLDQLAYNKNRRKSSKQSNDNPNPVLPSQNNNPTTKPLLRSQSSRTGMSYPVLPLQPNTRNTRSPSRKRTFEGSSPLTPNNQSLNFLLSSHSPSIEQNISYTRNYQHEQIPNPASSKFTAQSPPALTSGYKYDNTSDDDARFLRLAREALVATASGVSKNKDENLAGEDLLIDPTIQDLLQRLQYAASPHGNPIKKSDEIKANSNGQLMIQNFYDQFPNLSNDIFMNEENKVNHPSNRENTGWNFLVGEPLQLKSDDQIVKERARKNSIDKEATKKTKIPEKEENKPLDSSRKFLCEKCSMSFRRSSDLKRHEKQHLSIPPNICELCGKGFARKDALKRHMSTLTCKRNADRKLYINNLNYLKESRENGSQLDLKNDHEEDDDLDDDDDDDPNQFSSSKNWQL